MFETLLTTYGYPILFIGTVMEGETVMVLGGLSAQLGYLSLTWVILVGFLGALCGDQICFYLGRRHGQAMLVRFPSWKARADRALHRLHRHQNLVILSFRFLYGLRSVTPFVIGMSNVTYLRFVVLDLISAGIWSVCIALGGYYFGQAVGLVLKDIQKYQVALLTGIAGVALLVWLVHVYRQRRSF
jgi:membrane protein DedA with SNARE-associated domain